MARERVENDHEQLNYHCFWHKTTLANVISEPETDLFGNTLNIFN